MVKSTLAVADGNPLCPNIYNRSGEHELSERDKRLLGPLRGKSIRPADGCWGMPRRVPQDAGPTGVAPELAPLNIRPHMLRHAAGYYLVQRVPNLQLRAAFMGHKRVETRFAIARSTPTSSPGCAIRNRRSGGIDFTLGSVPPSEPKLSSGGLWAAYFSGAVRLLAASMLSARRSSWSAISSN